MMFCTTFLSAPSEEIHCEVNRGGGMGPGSCLSLHCVVLPRDEPNTSARVSICPPGRAPKPLLGDRGDGGVWDRVRRRRGRSASPSPSKTQKNSRREGAKGTSEGRPWRGCRGNGRALELKSPHGSNDANAECHQSIRNGCVSFQVFVAFRLQIKSFPVALQLQPVENQLLLLVFKGRRSPWPRSTSRTPRSATSTATTLR